MKTTILFLASLLSLAPIAHGETKADVYAFGAWPLCVGHVLTWVALDCTWYKPGTETYALGIKTDSAATDAYSYKITASMQDGSTKVVEGTAARKDNELTGYTDIPNLTFGGIVESIVSIDVTEHTTISVQHFAARPVAVRRMRRVPAGGAPRGVR
jgi:hypothetical protein